MTPERKQQISWALYDWANSAFATTVMAGFFPIFFAKYWATDLAAGERTYWLGIAGSVASVVVMFLAPVLGGVADRKGLKKKFLFVCTLVGALATAALYLVGKGDWPAALILFTVGSIAFFAGTSFYDSLIVHVAKPDELDRVSALGYGLGYLGGGVLFAINVAMALKPEVFGLADATIATRLSFVMVGLWWFAFAMPLFLKVPEAARPGVHGGDFAELVDTFKQLLRLKPAWMFLLAYWLYIDGVDTIIRMAVDYGVKLGFADSALISALLMVQFIGFPAAIFYGWLADRFGTKTMLFVAIAAYGGITLWAYTLQTERQFFMMAAAIGLVQGGIQSLSRSYYARLIPADRSGQFFGFYNMLGKFAAVFGPLAVGFTAAAFPDNQRLSILALLPFFVVGALLLKRVRPESATDAARR